MASTDPVHYLAGRLCGPTQDRIMITIIFPSDKPFSDIAYYSFLQGLNLFSIECTCHKKGCLIYYGWYKRSVRLPDGCLELSVQRVRCRECGRSHALLPSVLVPYSQITLGDQQGILICAEAGSRTDAILEQNPYIDEGNVKYIIRQYRRHWKERILSIGRTLLDSLTIPCLSAYSRQFMQIHRTPNILFCPPT